MDRTTVDIALRVASRPAAGQDVSRLLVEVCRDLATALDVAAAVVLVPESRWVAGSDDTATLVGRLQHQALSGLLWTAVRTLQPASTRNLAHEEPRRLGRLAAELGLGSSTAVPLVVDGRAVGALQLLGAAGQLITPRHHEMLAPLRGVLAARIVDALELRHRSAAPPVPLPAAPVDERTAAIPIPRRHQLRPVPPSRHRRSTRP